MTRFPSFMSSLPSAMYGCTSPLDPIVKHTKCKPETFLLPAVPRILGMTGKGRPAGTSTCSSRFWPRAKACSGRTPKEGLRGDMTYGPGDGAVEGEVVPDPLLAMAAVLMERPGVGGTVEAAEEAYEWCLEMEGGG